VYRQHGDDQELSSMPVMDPNAVPTEPQTQHRGKFATAISYAKEVLEQPDLKAEYDKSAPRGKSGYNMAVKDYFSKPEVNKISLAGSTITIMAKDDFRIASLAVTILSSGGVVLEEREATPNSVNREKWSYTTALTANELTGAVVRAVATDLPGNTGILEVSV
jgi:hypothetical protein